MVMSVNMIVMSMILIEMMILMMFRDKTDIKANDDIDNE